MVAGSLLSLAGCLVGNLAVIIVMVSRETAIPAAEILSRLTPGIVVDLSKTNFQFVDIIFYVLALSVGYKPGLTSKTYSLYLPSKENATIQPLSALAYAAAHPGRRVRLPRGVSGQRRRLVGRQQELQSDDTAQCPDEAVLVHHRLQPGDALPDQQRDGTGRPFFPARPRQEVS